VFRRRAQPAHPLSTTARRTLPAQLAYTRLRGVPFHPPKPFLLIPVGWAACGVAPLADRERGALQHGQLV
jgi:hypothetical protein